MIRKKPIVIIGGMGPQASSALYNLLINKAVSDHGVVKNEDFPYIVLQSLSVPDFIGSQDRRHEAIAIMKDASQIANNIGPSVVGMSCNTAHLFQNEMLRGIDLPFVSLIDVVVAEVKNKNINKIGILASPTTIKSGLYRKSLRSAGVKCITPTVTQQSELEDIIRKVISGRAGSAEAEVLHAVALDLVAKGAEGIILGCTELPLVFSSAKAKFVSFDCLDLLADELLRQYYNQYAILELKR